MKVLKYVGVVILSFLAALIVSSILSIVGSFFSGDFSEAPPTPWLFMISNVIAIVAIGAINDALVPDSKVPLIIAVSLFLLSSFAGMLVTDGYSFLHYGVIAIISAVSLFNLFNDDESASIN